MQVSRMSRKGQIVIPASIRKKYGLKEGEKLIFIEQDKQIIIKPRTKWTDICGSVKGLDMETARKQLGEMRKDDEEREKLLEEAARKIKKSGDLDE
jgi:AbrB family looped-hinge helix DNA binding protein